MIKYNKLFYMMIDRKIRPRALEQAGISRPTIARMHRDEPIDTKTIDKLCKALQCQPGDIMTYTEDKA